MVGMVVCVFFGHKEGNGGVGGGGVGGACGRYNKLTSQLLFLKQPDMTKDGERAAGGL